MRSALNNSGVVGSTPLKAAIPAGGKKPWTSALLGFSSRLHWFWLIVGRRFGEEIRNIDRQRDSQPIQKVNRGVMLASL
jgi:hypothetical protein